MKAFAVFPEKAKIGLVDHPEPGIQQPGEVKLRMLEVGVCGTDREICSFQYGLPPGDSDYLIIGHESLGEVVQVGAEVTGLKAGDLAVPMVRRPCPHEDCLSCRIARQDYCFTGDFQERGIKGLHGFMSEFVVDHEKYLVPVPGYLREIGVLVEPLTIAEKALNQVWNIQDRLPWACPVKPGSGPGYCHTAVVLGAGPVGILGAMVMVVSGFETFVYSRDGAKSFKAELVKAIGANYLSSRDYDIDAVASKAGNIDLVYEATGASKFSFEFMKRLGTNGAFAFTGVPGRREPVELDTDYIMRNLVLRNQVVFGTVNASREDFTAAIKHLELFKQRWPEEVLSLITGRYTLETCYEPLQGHSGGIKNVVSIQEEAQ